jgi:MbtH protein
MNIEENDDCDCYVVVKNLEEQYSILPEYREVPSGWSVVGPKGGKSLCLEYIREVWVDMRPLSTRAQENA